MSLQIVFAQCKLIDNGQSPLFIKYEKNTLVKLDGEDKLQKGVVLRFVNNSTCSVIITSGSADKFKKPLSTNPTIQQIIRQEINYDLPDGVLLPEVQYRFNTLRGFERSVGGDMFFGFQLLGNRSILFEVPFKHLDQKNDGKIMIEFQYSWELENRAKNVFGSSVTHTVQYYSAELPNSVKKEIKKSER